MVPDMRRLSVMAPAKVNLHLQVLGIRGDGYHDLFSVFQAVSLGDTLTLRTGGPAGSLEVRGRFDFPAGENIVARAVEAFRRETGVDVGVRIDVEKRIPIGGGLGGGSSDAAATVRGLEALFDLRLPAPRRRALAESLGSDVPFFLEAAAALVEGRGEQVHPLAPRTDFALVALFPPVTVRTVEAFQWLDESRPAGPWPEMPAREEVLGTYAARPIESWRFVNDFDEPVFSRLPLLRMLRDGLLAAGAACARLTGSGSTVIGVFEDAARARSCVRSMDGAGTAAGAGARAEVLFPLASLPSICYNRSMRIRHREATHGDHGYSHQEGRV